MTRINCRRFHTIPTFNFCYSSAIFLSNLGVIEKPVITEKTKKHLPKKKAQERLAAAKEKEEAAKAASEEPKAEEAEAKPAEDAQPAEEPKAEEAEAKKE